jgi:hypothetical protein
MNIVVLNVMRAWIAFRRSLRGIVGTVGHVHMFDRPICPRKARKAFWKRKRDNDDYLAGLEKCEARVTIVMPVKKLTEARD